MQVTLVSTSTNLLQNWSSVHLFPLRSMATLLWF